MTATLGRTLVLLSVLVATAGAFTGFAAGRMRSADGLRWSRRFAYAFATLMVLATLVMEYALITRDFSVSYVAQVGSRAVPLWVAIVSLWSSLEGSILFWGFVLALYIAGSNWMTRDDDSEFVAYAIGVWMACAAFFAFLIAGPATPFATVSPVPLDGPGPNALLQNHVLMIIHPPFLYLGYVGMTIPFGFACAALLRGHLGASLLRGLRTSLLLPWIFLTIAIMLGGWWAYEVLGWGGYWAWDPVENASLLPWLTATAALHSAIVLERRGTLKGWTVTLVQATFLLTILGTFMTRSGVFNSVHSFTQSEIGPTLLVFLGIALLASVAMLAFRVDLLQSEGSLEGPVSRETMFLVNNLFFVLLTFTVLIGTIFPLIVEAVNGKQMSVGRPYFDTMVVPIGAALLFLMGVGPALPWGRASRDDLIRGLVPPLASGFLLAGLGFALRVTNGWTLLTLGFGGYAAHVTLAQMWRPAVVRLRRGESVAGAIGSQMSRGRRRFGSYLAHAGAVTVMIAIAVSSTMKTTREVSMTRGERAPLGAYAVRFTGAESIREPHRDSSAAHFEITRNGRHVTTLSPRMNQYATMREPIGTPDVHSTWKSDLYLSILSVDVGNQKVAVTMIETPMVIWIWLAVFLMGIGGLVALIPYRAPRMTIAHELDADPGLGTDRVAEPS